MRRRLMPCEFSTHLSLCRLDFTGDRYEKVEDSTRAGIDVPLPTSWTAEDVEGWLEVHAAAVNADKAVEPDTDLFVQGFDRWVEN
jgi:hypothetical protein